MRFTSFVIVAAAQAASVLAGEVAPDFKRDNSQISDITVLQYATTLEHLENAFYSGALAKFDAGAFAAAGFPDWVRGRFTQIAEHEASHVAFLTKALGDQAPKKCEYNFPYTDPKSFAALSLVLEGVGTSAYLGAAQYITNKDYLTAAGSILAVEAQHDAWVGSAVAEGSAWGTAYETPLGLSGVFSLASQFIKSCPSSNPKLPVKSLPTMTLSPAAPAAGSTVAITSKGYKTGSKAYVAWFTGLQVLFSEVSGNSTTVPSALTHQGTVYAALVSSNTAAPKDDQLLSGLAVVAFASSSVDRQ